MADYFGEALKNMTGEMAVGGAVRHLADLGYDVKRIRDRLDYPVSEDQIRDILWKYCIDTSRIVMTEPAAGSVRTKVSYIRETDNFGRSSFRRIEEPVDEGNASEFTPCDFGIRRAKDEVGFMNYLSVLSEEDRIYITDLPWPRMIVWHVLDERMRRIKETLQAGQPD